MNDRLSVWQVLIKLHWCLFSLTLKKTFCNDLSVREDNTTIHFKATSTLSVYTTKVFSGRFSRHFMLTKIINGTYNVSKSQLNTYVYLLSKKYIMTSPKIILLCLQKKNGYIHQVWRLFITSKWGNLDIRLTSLNSTKIHTFDDFNGRSSSNYADEIKS